MAIPDFETYLAKARAARRIHQGRGTMSIAFGSGVGMSSRFWTMWRTAPGLGQTPSTAAACDSSIAGAIRGPGPVNGGLIDSLTVQRIARIAQLDGGVQLAPVSYYLADRLSHQGGLSATTVGTAQTTNLPTAALTRYTDGAGVMAALQTHADIGWGVAVATCSYTNQAGTAGRTSPSFFLVTHRQGNSVCWMPLQSGDTGVRSVESVTLANNGVALTKNAGNSFDANDAWTYSNEGIAGDGYMEFCLGFPLSYTPGLSVTPAAGASTVDYGLSFNSLWVGAIENGTGKGTAQPLSMGDVFRIERVGTQVNYYKNGVLLYASAIASTGTLKVNISISTLLGAVCGVKLYDAGVDTALTWNHTNIAASTGTGTAGNFGVTLYKLLDCFPVTGMVRDRWRYDAVVQRGGYMPQIVNGACLEVLGSSPYRVLSSGDLPFVLHTVEE